MQFLSVSEIVVLHKELIDRFGGLHGIRDKGLLESAITHPKLLYTIKMERDLYLLAASYGFHLIKNHSFIDGNKRIGALAMLIFLRVNEVSISIPKNDLYQLAMDIANSKVNEKEITEVLRNFALAVEA